MARVVDTIATASTRFHAGNAVPDKAVGVENGDCAFSSAGIE
jgi:hypothetical protein